MNQKLYIITRRDLAPGAQAVQSCHALTEFALQFPDDFEKWKENSNYICILSVENEVELETFLIRVNDEGIAYSCFYEPDFGSELTAVCLEPTRWSEFLCRNLPLVLEEYNENKF